MVSATPANGAPPVVIIDTMGGRTPAPTLNGSCNWPAPAAGSAAVLGKNFAGNSAPASTLGQKLDDIYSRQGRQLQAVHEVDARNVADVADAFNAMQEGDVFFYISALRRPLEMDVNEKRLKGAIARASARHAFLCYIRPEPGYLRELGDFTDVDAEFEAFKDRIRKVAPHADLSNVTLTTVGGCPLFAIPDFKWEVFLSTSITAPHRALAGALVAARSGTSVRVPLSLDATKTILAELESIDLPQRIRQLLRERAEGGT